MFTPKREQSLVKSKFYRYINNNPMIGDTSNISISKIASITKSSKIETWAKLDGFMDWFLDSNYIEDLMEADLELGMDRLRELLASPMGGEKTEVRPSEMLKAIEMLLKYTGRDPKKDKVEEATAIPDDQLDKLIAKEIEAQAKIKAV